MKSFRTISYAAGCAVMLLASSAANAYDPDTNFYMGGNVGASKVNLDTGAVSTSLIAVGKFTSAATTADQYDTGFKVFGGYRFHPNFAVEVGYFNLGRINFTSVTTGPASTVVGSAKNNDGFNVDLVGILPVKDAFSVFGRVGVQTSKTSISAPVRGVNFSSSETNTDYKAGLGLQYDFFKEVGARLEWEHFRVPGGFSLIGKQNVDLFSLGVVIRF